MSSSPRRATPRGRSTSTAREPSPAALWPTCSSWTPTPSPTFGICATSPSSFTGARRTPGASWNTRSRNAKRHPCATARARTPSCPDAASGLQLLQRGLRRLLGDLHPARLPLLHGLPEIPDGSLKLGAAMLLLGRLGVPTLLARVGPRGPSVPSFPH